MHNWNENIYTNKLNSFGTALSAAKYPVSGSFIDVSNYNRFAFLIFLGTFTTDLVFTVQEATAANGTPVTITGATKTFESDDEDNAWGSIEVGAENMTAGYRFVTLDVAGPAGGDDFGCIVFVAWDVRHRPVTQPANYLYAVRIPTGS